MLILVFVLMTLGIVQSQAMSRAGAVTLRWLRLGDLIALSLLAVTAIMVALQWRDSNTGRTVQVLAWPAATLGLGVIAHLVAVQLGRRSLQRAISAMSVAVVAVLVANWCRLHVGTEVIAADSNAGDLLVAIRAGATTMPAWSTPARIAGMVVGVILAGWLIGGSLMTMLLGHAYLTAGGEMTQRPFQRLGNLLMGGMLVRTLLAASSCVAWMWWISVLNADDGRASTWTVLLLSVRFLIGIVVPAGLVWMAVQCVKIRSYQSATGIFYVASLMIFIGELTALSLVLELGWVI